MVLDAEGARALVVELRAEGVDATLCFREDDDTITEGIVEGIVVGRHLFPMWELNLPENRDLLRLHMFDAIERGRRIRLDEAIARRGKSGAVGSSSNAWSASDLEHRQVERASRY